MNDEDTELKDVLIRSLNENGILPKIQAQLRAAIYVALENHNFGDFLKPSNETLRSFIHNEDGLLITSLVVDFLSKMKLDNTLEVLKLEAELDDNMIMSPGTIASQFGNELSGKEKPIIAQFVSQCLPPVSQRSESGSRTDCHSFSSDRRQNLPNGSIARKTSIPVATDKVCADEQQQQPPPLRSTSNVSSASSNSGATISTHQNGSVSRAGATGDCDGEKDTARSGFHPTVSVTKPDGEATGPKHPQSGSAFRRTESSFSPGDQVGHPTAYQDDFDSPQSSESTGSNTVTPTTATSSSLHFNSEGAHSNAHRPASSQGSFTPRDAGQSPKTPASDASSQPVIRVYLQTSPRRTRPGQEDSSDIDDENDEEECLSLTAGNANPGAAAASEQSGGRKSQPGSAKQVDDDDVTVDQTINSDDSLSLDHAEDVLPTTTASRARR